MIAALCLFGVLAAVGLATHAEWPSVLGAILVAGSGASVVVQTRRLRVAGDRLVVSSLVRRRTLDRSSCVFTAKPYEGSDDTASTILVHGAGGDRGATVAVGEAYAPGRAIQRLAGALLEPTSVGAQLARDGAVAEPPPGRRQLLAIGVAAAALGAVGWAVVVLASQ